jgi:tetratricopeptide (TPR) repeat protein
MIRSLAALAAGDKAQSRAILEGNEELNPYMVDLYRAMIDRYPIEQLAALAPSLALQVHLAQRPGYAALSLELADGSLAQMPDEPLLLARRSEALQLLGRNKEALAVLDRLGQVAPEVSVVTLAKADLHLILADEAARQGEMDQAREQRRQAEQLCREALEADPNNPAGLEKLALILQTEEHMEEANPLYEKMIEIDPDNWTAYNNLAWNEAEAGHWDRAALLAGRALELAPENAGVQDTLGWIHLRQGRTREALELLQAAADRLPANPEVRFHLAQALDAAGRAEDAIEQLEAIMLATPGYPRMEEVDRMLERLDADNQLRHQEDSEAQN